MASRTLKLQPQDANPLLPSTETSPSSSSPTNTRLTPNSNSDDDDTDSDLELQESGESYQMRSRGEKGAGYDSDDFEGVGYADDFLERRRASVSTVQSYQLYTPDEERAVVKKFDRRLVLFVALLYMLSFLDRSSMFLVFNHTDSMS
jgi:hypothetical protein